MTIVQKKKEKLYKDEGGDEDAWSHLIKKHGKVSIDDESCTRPIGCRTITYGTFLSGRERRVSADGFQQKPKGSRLEAKSRDALTTIAHRQAVVVLNPLHEAPAHEVA